MEKWELAYKDYEQGMKYKEIADKYDVAISTVRSWKARKWDAPPKENVATQRNDVATQIKPLIIDNNSLTEQQKMFCLFYLQHFNATKAYMQAYQCDYQSANANSRRMIVNDSINNEIRRLKAELQQNVHLTTQDLIQEYIKQSFSDMTDYVDFGTEDAEDLTGKKYKRNFVRIKDAKDVDGSLIQEIKTGRDGVVVKLYDKQKAMNELIKLFSNSTEDSTEDKVDELLSKIKGELNESS